MFFDGIKKHIPQAEVHAFEIDKTEAKKSSERSYPLNITLETSDFLKWANKHFEETKFDAVLGNPPYIRYQYLPEEFQKHSEDIFRKSGCKFTKHTNAWVPFIMASIALLNPAGRLAMVVPSEIIHILHANSLRTFLIEQCHHMVLIDPEELWFENTSQGTVILLAEKKSKPSNQSHGLGIYPVKNREFLKIPPEEIFQSTHLINGVSIENKWTKAFLDSKTLSLISEIETDISSKNNHFCRFNDIAKVAVGICTGANEFFMVNEETVDKFNLSEWAYPCFNRSKDCQGVIYNTVQHQKNVEEGKPSNFLWFKNAKSMEKHPYIQYGENSGFNTPYKCRIRKLWYVVPSVYSTEIGMLRFFHETPKLILNEINAFTTDSVSRIQTDCPPAELVYTFTNSLTALSAELEGRHYGGGVGELIPSEIKRLVLPVPNNAMFDLADLDTSFKNLPINEILEKQSEKVLSMLSKSDQMTLLSGWEQLKNRRQRKTA